MTPTSWHVAAQAAIKRERETPETRREELMRLFKEFDGCFCEDTFEYHGNYQCDNCKRRLVRMVELGYVEGTRFDIDGIMPHG